MKIRRAQINDLKVIKELYWLLDGDAVYYQPEHFIRTQRPDDFILDSIKSEKADFLLVEEDNRTIGFALLRDNQTAKISCLQEHRYLQVDDLVIAKEYRDQGYGSKLLAAAKSWGQDRNLEFLRLSVFSKNEGGIRFYERHGLQERMIKMECEL
ncbi:ribosomal protein S18 acetylase RimI-like enzyme [Orenia metallireducens]|jgi:ribosomal protein S18 acetylase RimI-like enzyme|uniref:Ribosomal protein S18 acetylase RimI n=1 Tax=Orenia metallireducens TaxID=1413210 RepID=A0A285HVW5_9FIRM|nr:GNAT family N-acetyltransferase [Orenia metallireducens]PRX29318.1 ribosomal protein S18 acetylase RimI-like enzyme [Orenia metallireducens]SNY39845.1 Ribosomal protein S18 acetylase RimI [Orenia metallireducens]